MPIEDCWRDTGKPPIRVKWLHVNKGDDLHREYRSRLVAQEIKTDKREDLFAATPPLEAKKWLMSLVVTKGIGYQKTPEDGMCFEFIDISCAFFHADVIRKVYIQLPMEDYEEGKCWLLLKSLCGTRDAAQNWGVSYMTFMENLGFANGIASL